MEHDYSKRPRLDNFESSSSIIHTYQSPMVDIPMTERPFSNVLINLGRQTKHQLSDKKLIVYDLKVDSPSLPDGYQDNVWSTLQNSIYAIQQNHSPSESLEVLYQLCENLCQHELGSQLYDHLKSTCQEHVEKMFLSLESDISEGTTYLEHVRHMWSTYSHQMNQIRCIFLYLDRTHHSIMDLATELFRSYYSQSSLIRQKVMNSILDMITSERCDKKIDSVLLKNSLRMLMDLHLYYTEFEGRFLEQTRQFYQDEGDRLIQEMPMSKYLEHIANRVHQESIIRVKQYFDKSSKAAITTIVEDQLLSNRVQDILEKSFNYFMDHRSEDDLSLLYQLLQKVDKLDICAKYFVTYVKTKGTSILKNHAKDKDLFATLLSFMRRVDSIVRHSFEDDDLFVNGCKDSFSYFINLRQNNTTVLLANYIDLVLRNEKVDEKLLDTCMTFFRLLQTKDTFEILYKQDLAKRLILDVGNVKFEKAMLARMKKDSGPAYTSKLEKMLRDIKYSYDLMMNFKEQQVTRDSDTWMDLNVNVLTYGFWPSYTPIDIRMPSQFQRVQDEFQTFYTNKYPKRRLKWLNALSVCEVESNYPKGTYMITLTLLQTIILILFNNTSKSEFSFGEILAATNLDELELRRTLKSLVCGQHALLKKYPSSPDVEQTDQFIYNHDFESTETRIWMNTEKLNEAIENSVSVDQPVLIARDQQVDAAIVRILKSKQSLSHGALLGEVTRQIRFPVTALEVKQRIEVLIEKEYIERTADNGYRYT
ncbi:Cullin family-domain-containing protein [Halteromyces radiatus]|uniref:Cullin family-domain-containing protein n=1 Tax=Halteromyces radiatus TaxID=101107 RepID=UPI002220DF5F|nr:Cullin family-domain-containing protein [Halteromyces radiatus]KAI8099695.1 Cullin family-domain-containing protein [Halteromyces radiatus]